MITCEDNMKLMARYEDKHFDLAIVDPPYGIGIDGQKESKKAKNQTGNIISKNNGIMQYQIKSILMNCKEFQKTK